MKHGISPRVLVIDDDRDLASLVQVTLQRQGYSVEIAHDAAQALRRAYAFRPDVVLLDILMAGMDGWEVLRQLREMSDVPVVMVTAVRGEDAVVKGLGLGADDYVTKPFGLQELRARIEAVLRRASMSPADEPDVLRFDGGRLVIDPSTQRVTVRDEEVSLAPTEYRLLLYLATNAGRTLTHAQILGAVWGPGYEASSSIVKVYVQRLRHKIEPDPRRPRYVLNQRGVGYGLAEI